MDGLDLIGMRRHDGIPGHVSADQGGIDVDHLARGDLGRATQAWADRVRMALKRSAPQRWRMRVRDEWSGRVSCKP